MKIFTSYFDNIGNIPEDMVTISIAGKCPDWYMRNEFKVLAPKYGFFMEWKKNKDNNYYIKHFNEEVLNLLDADDIAHRLCNISDGKDIVLLCYEAPDDFCHRHLVAKWLCENGYYVEELKVA